MKSTRRAKSGATTDVVAEILALEAEYARKSDLEFESRPGPPASEAAIAAAETARSRRFPASYRAFLAKYDGWENVDFGMMLYSTSDFVETSTAEPLGM